jgi:hypothetical protein
MATYSFIDYTSPVSCPPRKPNGGLYSGELAHGPWGNYPVVPEPDILSQNLISADPPPGAIKQPTSFERPGNNHVVLPYHKQANEYLNVKCISK